MRIKLFAADEGACGAYRMVYPAEAVMESGADLDVLVVSHSRNAHEDLKIVTAGTLHETHVVAVEPIDCDVLVLQRPMYRLLIEAIPLIQAQGTAVVVETDDDFSSIHPHNPAYGLSQVDLNPEMNIAWHARALELADMVICSTPALAKMHGPLARVVPNYIPKRTVRQSDHPELRHPLTVGWPGNPHVHAGDLETVGSAVANVVETGSAQFLTIGIEETLDRLGIAHGTVIPWCAIDQLPELLDQIDVGIVPLALSRFNESKSWIKGLEFAARGIPFVASPTGEYERLAARGAGDLARTPNKWTSTLLRLLVDDDYRAERAERTHAVARTMVIEDHVDEWIAAWSDAWSVRSRR